MQTQLVKSDELKYVYSRHQWDMMFLERQTPPLCVCYVFPSGPLDAHWTG